jgi:DNA-binding beta-propeller fold protein YncE
MMSIGKRVGGVAVGFWLVVFLGLVTDHATPCEKCSPPPESRGQGEAKSNKPKKNKSSNKVRSRKGVQRERDLSDFVLVKDDHSRRRKSRAGGSKRLHVEQELEEPLVVYLLDIYGTDRVVFLDPLSGAFNATVNLAEGLPFQLTSPQRIDGTPDDSLLVVTNLGASFEGAVTPPHIAFIDTATARIVGRVILEARERPGDIEVSPDGRLAYVAVSTGRDTSPFYTAPRVLVVDIAARRIVEEIRLSQLDLEPGDLALTADGALLFAFGGVDRTRGRIHVIDTQTRSVIATVEDPPTFTGDVRMEVAPKFAMHPNGSTLYVGPVTVLPFSSPRNYGIAELDTSTSRFRAVIPLGELRGTNNVDLAITRDGADLYFSDSLGGRLYRIDTLRREIVENADVGQGDLGQIYTLELPPDL